MDWPVASIILAAIISVGGAVIVALVQWQPFKKDKSNGNGYSGNGSLSPQSRINLGVQANILNEEEWNKHRRELDRIIWTTEEITRSYAEFKAWSREMDLKFAALQAENLTLLRKLEERSDERYTSIDTLIRKIIDAKL